MKNSLKGVFLSGLVFPGLGQIILKKYKRGIAFMLAVIISLIAIIVTATKQAMTVLEKTDLKDGNIDLHAVSEAASNSIHASDELIVNLGLIVILLCWIIGTVDAYRIGKKMDSELQNHSSLPSPTNFGERER